MRERRASSFRGAWAKTLSDMAMLQCLRGIRDDGATLHGFRASFSTWAREQTDFNHEIVEAAPAIHSPTRLSRFMTEQRISTGGGNCCRSGRAILQVMQAKRVGCVGYRRLVAATAGSQGPYRYHDPACMTY